MEHQEFTEGEATQAGEGGVRDLIEKTLLLGIGAAALTKDRVQSVVDEFIRRGQITREEGKDMVERLSTRSREEARSAVSQLDSTLQNTYRELGLASRRELEDIEFRMRQIEHRLSLLERGADSAPDDNPGASLP